MQMKVTNCSPVYEEQYLMQCSCFDERKRFERGVEEPIFVKLEQPSLNSGGGFRHQLSAAWALFA